MRFNCNKVPYEYKRKKLEKEAARLREWHKVFAWTPKHFENSHQCAVLEFVLVKYPDAAVWEQAWEHYDLYIDKGSPVYAPIERADVFKI